MPRTSTPLRPRRLLRLAAGSTALALSLAAWAAPAAAREYPLSVQNSFRIGTSGVPCTAQNAPADPRLSGIFDRGYRLTCRDAAGAVGTLIAVRREVPIGEAPSAMPGVAIECGATSTAEIDTLGAVAAVTCRDPRSNVDYRRYATTRGDVTYFVEGLAGYDPALRLALASVIADRPVEGDVRVAVTEVSDAAAFARVQAGALNAEDARDEAYVRNNAFRFAEASEFFETLASRNRDNAQALAEALANQGLQQSNLGNFAAANRLFGEAQGALSASDAVGQRLIRNYRAINALNQRDPARALTELEANVAPVSENFDENALRQGVINLPLSDQINRENLALQRLGGIDPGLTAVERAEILDGQAQALAGTAARQQGRLDDAAGLLSGAYERVARVRDGRVLSTMWLRSEVQIEQALVAEAQGRRDEAGTYFDRAIATVSEAYPQSPALLAAKARKAGFLGRTGDSAGAKALFAEVVQQSPSVPDSGASLRELLGPYFDVLASEGTAPAASEMFAASQVLQRPGVAQTQAILAREMSEGNDEAAALFRLSVARTREIARTEAEIAQLEALPETEITKSQRDNLSAAREALVTLRQGQTELVSKLAAFPRYKALAPQTVGLDELQGGLREGEAYYKMMIVDDDVFALLAMPGTAQVFEIEGGVAGLDEDVRTLRDSIVRVENGQQVNYPFDVERARKLFVKLFGPAEAQVTAARHLIVEPDGPMLQLPPYLLVTADKGVEAYTRRQARADADPFDFTGVDWLGRGRQVSIAVSPRGFLDIRRIAPSQARNNYLGLGQNAVPSAVRPVAAFADECSWPLATWRDPIAPDELFFAQSRLDRGGSRVLTGAEFTDTRLTSDETLDNYRILHFATHGLVTAPRPDCPARPALVTSFGGGESDGLLSFREIFDMKLDADLVILSACDTAGMATVGASREAGVTTGGNYALDGLVRAFVGAGARTVVASHWPVPDDFDATKRLIGGLLEARTGEPLAEALAEAQQKLMDDPNTSHPFYWAAFIILGDGAKALVPAARAADGGAPATRSR